MVMISEGVRSNNRDVGRNGTIETKLMFLNYKEKIPLSNFFLNYKEKIPLSNFFLIFNKSKTFSTKLKMSHF